MAVEVAPPKTWIQVIGANFSQRYSSARILYCTIMYHILLFLKLKIFDCETKYNFPIIPMFKYSKANIFNQVCSLLHSAQFDWGLFRPNVWLLSSLRGSWWQLLDKNWNGHNCIALIYFTLHCIIQRDHGPKLETGKVAFIVQCSIAPPDFLPKLQHFLKYSHCHQITVHDIIFLHWLQFNYYTALH